MSDKIYIVFKNRYPLLTCSMKPVSAFSTTEYFELFLRNLLLEENKELHNRSMHISGLLKVDIMPSKVDIEQFI